MYKRIVKVVFLLFFIVSPFVISSSKGAGMGGTPPPPCGGPFPPCPVPLDSGIVLLLIAGVSYGGKKLYDSTKKNPA